MTDSDDRSADVARMRKLKRLSAAGLIDGPLSYFNHLIGIYGDLGRPGTRRTLTDRERTRVDVFFASLSSTECASRVAVESDA